MATQNYWSNYTNPPATNPTGLDAVNANSGVRLHHLENTVAIASTDASGSTYLLFKNVPWNARLADLKLEVDALGGSAAVSVGLFDSLTGNVVSNNCLASGLSAVSAAGKNAPLDGLAALTHAQTLQCLYEIAGDTPIPNQGPKHPNYDIVLTLGTAGASGGSITARMNQMPAG